MAAPTPAAVVKIYPPTDGFETQVKAALVATAQSASTAKAVGAVYYGSKVGSTTYQVRVTVKAGKVSQLTLDIAKSGDKVIWEARSSRSFAGKAKKLQRKLKNSYRMPFGPAAAVAVPPECAGLTLAQLRTLAAKKGYQLSKRSANTPAPATAKKAPKAQAAPKAPAKSESKSSKSSAPKSGGTARKSTADVWAGLSKVTALPEPGTPVLYMASKGIQLGYYAERRVKASNTWPVGPVVRSKMGAKGAERRGNVPTVKRADMRVPPSNWPGLAAVKAAGKKWKAFLAAEAKAVKASAAGMPAPQGLSL